MNQYTDRAEYSPESGEYVGVYLEYPFRYSRAPTAHEVIEGLERMIDEVVADMTAAGATPPASLTDLRVRTSPALHFRSWPTARRPPPSTTCSRPKIGGLRTGSSATIEW
jgi:hypothetical protein